ncbi:MAG: adenosylcobinamide-GDP ribazoletransferase [Methermicoccaceae archaeon]
MSSFVDGLRAGFGILSTIPVINSDSDVRVLSERTFLFVLVGLVLGVLLGGVGAVAHLSLPSPASPLVPVVVLCAIYVLCGFNHLDGLSDMGDGMTAHGSREKKVNAMKDTATGVGGMAYVVIYVISLYAVMLVLTQNVSPLVFAGALATCEVCAKHTMVGVAAMGTPLHEGLGAMFVRGTQSSTFLLSLLLSLLIGTALSGVVGIIAVLAATLASAVVVHRAHAHFGGVSGDVLGASNELGRLAALLCMGVYAAYGGGLWTLW